LTQVFEEIAAVVKKYAAKNQRKNSPKTEFTLGEWDYGVKKVLDKDEHAAAMGFFWRGGLFEIQVG
jgi:hypothetical protein